MADLIAKLVVSPPTVLLCVALVLGANAPENTAPRDVVALVLLTLAMVVGAVWARRIWVDTHGEGDELSDSPEALLEQFRDAHATGELDDAEFARVRQLLKSGGALGAERPAPRPTPAPPRESAQTPPAADDPVGAD